MAPVISSSGFGVNYYYTFGCCLYDVTVLFLALPQCFHKGIAFRQLMGKLDIAVAKL